MPEKPDPSAPVDWGGEPAEPAPERRRGKLDPESKARIQREHAAALTKPPQQVRAGVNLAWLAAAFKLDVRTVKLRLGDLQPIGKFGERKSDVYDFQDAVARLSKPLPDKFDRWMRGLSQSLLRLEGRRGVARVARPLRHGPRDL